MNKELYGTILFYYLNKLFNYKNNYYSITGTVYISIMFTYHVYL